MKLIASFVLVFAAVALGQQPCANQPLVSGSYGPNQIGPNVTPLPAPPGTTLFSPVVCSPGESLTVSNVSVDIALAPKTVPNWQLAFSGATSLPGTVDLPWQWSALETDSVFFINLEITGPPGTWGILTQTQAGVSVEMVVCAAPFVEPGHVCNEYRALSGTTGADAGSVTTFLSAGSVWVSEVVTQYAPSGTGFQNVITSDLSNPLAIKSLSTSLKRITGQHEKIGSKVIGGSED